MQVKQMARTCILRRVYWFCSTQLSSGIGPSAASGPFILPVKRSSLKYYALEKKRL
jgi:hypothetical protein